jgi:hypothetical protein
MLCEICEALAAVATRTPLLLILEDLHWGDPSTLDFISALARHRSPARIMLVATYRPADLGGPIAPLDALKLKRLSQGNVELVLPGVGDAIGDVERPQEAVDPEEHRSAVDQLLTDLGRSLPHVPRFGVAPDINALGN